MEATQQKPRDPRALNAYRHELTGQVRITTLEDQVAYDKHCEGIFKRYLPEGALEANFAQLIADDLWRLHRASALEDTVYGIGLSEPDKYIAHHEQIDAAFSRAVAWLKDGKNFNLMSLYEGRMQRKLARNIQILDKMQAARKAAHQQVVEEAELLAKDAALQGETYNIEQDFPPEALPQQFVFSLPEIAREVAHRGRLAAAKLRLEHSPCGVACMKAAPPPLKMAA